MIRLILLVAVALLTSISAHQDTRLELKGNEISGMPDRYKSAQFVDDGKALLINGKKLLFPDVILRMLCFEPSLKGKDDADPFEDRIKVVDLSRLELWSSWYHFPSRLPPYLSIRKIDEARGVRVDVLVNLEDVSIIEASVSVKDSRSWWTEFPVAIEEPSIPKPAPVSLEAIIGKWRSSDFHIELATSSIKTTDVGEPPIELSGKIAQKEPGVLVLEHPNGTKRDVNYSLSGDILTLWWGEQRSGIQSVEVARVGGKTDTLFRSLTGQDQSQEGSDR
jgi:hypothetical protein